jgi:hypothetical protein
MCTLCFLPDARRRPRRVHWRSTWSPHFAIDDRPANSELQSLSRPPAVRVRTGMSGHLPLLRGLRYCPTTDQRRCRRFGFRASMSIGAIRRDALFASRAGKQA